MPFGPTAIEKAKVKSVPKLREDTRQSNPANLADTF